MTFYAIDGTPQQHHPMLPQFTDGIRRDLLIKQHPTYLPQWLIRLLWHTALMESARQPDYFDLPGYMLRNWVHCPEPRRADGVPENESGRLHTILRSDAERHLHDHPRDYCTIILSGGYWEETPVVADAPLGARHIEWIAPGRVLMRKAEQLHRLIVPNDQDGDPIPCTTLFMTGPKTRDWGFAIEDGWVQWEEYGKRFGVPVL